MLKSKNPRGFYYTNIKSFSNKSARTFWPEQLLYIKVDFGASDFEAAVLLQIEVKSKMLGRSVTFEPRSVEKRFQQQNFFELTTSNPNVQKCHFFTVMKLNIIAIYVVKLKAVLRSQFLTNLDKIWYVQVSTQGTSTHRISSRSVQKQKSFFLCSTFTVK